MSAKSLDKLIDQLNHRLKDLENQIQEHKERQKAAVAEAVGHRMTLNTIEELSRGEEASSEPDTETQGQAEWHDDGDVVVDE